MELYHLHPAAVHFPIAFLNLGLAAQACAFWRRGPAWLEEAAGWLLWLGTAAAWGALALGLLAERTAPHVPRAWEVLAEHQTLAYWTVGLFTALSAWRALKSRAPAAFPPSGRIFLYAWLAAACVLAATAYHGGEMVFKYGMGVR